MHDNELYKEIAAVLNAGLTANDISGVTIAQDYQPTNQGVISGRAFYLNKVPGDRRFGFPYRANVWDQDEGVMVNTFVQQYESTFQLTAQSIQDPSALSLTASDLANYAATFLQTDYAVQYFLSKGIGILRITEVRNPSFINDKNHFEQSPNFDFTLTHEQVIISSSPVVEKFEYNIKRV